MKTLEESLEKLQEIIQEQEGLKESNDEKTQTQESITEQQKELNKAFSAFRQA